jgi:hypothetical protein
MTMTQTLNTMVRIALSASGLAECVPGSCLVLELLGHWLGTVVHRGKLMLAGVASEARDEAP